MALADTAALIASLTLEDKFSRPAAAVEGSLGRIEGKMRGVGTAGASVRSGLLQTIGVLGGAFAIKQGFEFAIDAASDLQESLSKSNVVFEDNAAAVEDWSKTSATAFGQSSQQALEAAATYGNLFRAMGITTDKSTDMSTSLVELAADLASFNNTTVDDALIALRSGLVGESEPLRRYGVQLNEARLKQEAFRLGLVETTTEALDPAVKAQAAYSIILQDTALAQGDFARTSGGLANQQRILRANLTNVAATIGTALLPKVTDLVGKINDLVTNNGPAIESFADNLGDAFDAVLEIAGNLPWTAIGDAFRLMGTGSKALLDAFTSLPPWVQTAVLTAWGFNKITGGAIGNIVGSLTGALSRMVFRQLGIAAGSVTVTGPVVGGPGGVAGTAGRGAVATAGTVITKILGVVSAAALGAIIGSEIGHAVFFDPTVKPAVEFESSQFDRLVQSGDREAIQRGLRGVEDGLADLDALGPLRILAGDQYDILVSQRDTLRDLLATMPKTPVSPENRPTGPVATGSQPIPVAIPASPTNDLAQSRQFLRNVQTATSDTSRTATNSLSTQRRANYLTDSQIGQDRYANALRSGEALRSFFLMLASLGVLRQIAAKNFSPTIIVKNATTTNISGRTVATSYLENQLRIGTGPTPY